MVPVIVDEGIKSSSYLIGYICPFKSMARAYSPIAHSVPPLAPIEMQFKRTVFIHIPCC